MTYRLTFSEKAAKEWNKLDSTIRNQFQTVLARRLKEPHIPSARLRGKTQRYKIKLKAAGYRLLYEVRDAQLIVLVIAIGRREDVYDAE